MNQPDVSQPVASPTPPVFSPNGYYYQPFPTYEAVYPNTAQRYGGYWAVIVIFGAVWVSLLFLGTQGVFAAAAALESLPFLPLVLLAYAGRRSDVAKQFAFGWWVFFIGSIGVGSCFAVLASFTEEQGTLFSSEAIRSAALSGFGIYLGGLAGVLCFMPVVRRRVARVLPIDPESFVHATALATVVALTTMAFMPLLVLGEPPLLDGFVHQAGGGAGSQTNELLLTIYGFLWLVPATVVAVGFPHTRNFGAALQRLGLVRPSVKQVAFAIVAVGALVGSMLGVEAIIKVVWQTFDWPLTDQESFSELMDFARSPIGALVVGVTAGLGEELAVRGVLQPRLGILLSNLFFTGLHAMQYNWDGLLSVFLIGLILGVIRKYTNTTTSAIVHGGYDYMLIMIEIFSVSSS